MNPKTRAAATLVAALVVGIYLGNITASPTETKYKVLHDTETKTITKTVEVPGPAPKECADLVEYARTVLKAAEQFDLTNSDVLDIMSELRVAVAMGNSNAANDLETRLRKVDAKTIEAIETLGETKQPLDDAASACEGK